MRSCHTVLHPDTDDRALRATEARCAWVEHDAEHGEVVATGPLLPWREAMDAAVLAMQAQDGPAAVLVGTVEPGEVPGILAAEVPPVAVVVVRPGAREEVTR